ncbi:unnamed protein product [Brugia pahangi]|uniref:Uncharacterized protein n=1 Tax=Brugia pahangi TaxID=6280 RepID=A0A0N4TKW3_BRUPA|nr:unnamed protein product [Brugia pahangi]
MLIIGPTTLRFKKRRCCTSKRNNVALQDMIPNAILTGRVFHWFTCGSIRNGMREDGLVLRNSFHVTANRLEVTLLASEYKSHFCPRSNLETEMHTVRYRQRLCQV